MWAHFLRKEKCQSCILTSCYILVIQKNLSPSLAVSLALAVSIALHGAKHVILDYN